MSKKLSIMFPILLATAVSGPLMIQPALGSDAEQHWAGFGHQMKVHGTDDWLPVPPSGEVYCSQGEVDLSNLLMPLCPPGTTLEIRNATGYSEMHADDPRLAGLLTYEFSGSFDSASFTGPAWGTWNLESHACNATWKGRWFGQRTWVPGQSNPLDAFMPPGFGGVWISRLELRGRGTGDCVDGLRMSGVELVTTLTPMPVSYEMLMPCDELGCLPEGVTSASIRRAWRN